MPASRTVDATPRAILGPRSEITPTRPGRLLPAANRLSPRFVDRAPGRWTRRLHADGSGLAEVQSVAKASRTG